MGRSGSRYLTVEQCYGLDLANLRRAGFFDVPNVKATSPWRWTTGDDPTVTAEVELTIDLRVDPPRYRISYAADSPAGPEPVEIRGQLLTTRPQYGGVRYWWACPRCDQRRRVLYVYPRHGRHRFACRRCQGLRYYVHRETRTDRLHRRAKKMWRRAGSEDGHEPWEKPKWMRWATFSRLVLAGREAQEAGDRIILGRLGRALASIQAGRRRGMTW
jgi:hypothetical protein